MGNCKDCEHWDRDGGTYERYDDDGEEIGDHARTCLKVVHGNESKPGAAAYVTDASGYMARLWAAPDFGCALFEAKEPETQKP
jgi:hypothetical protein